MAPTAGKPATLGMDVIAPRQFEGKVAFRKVHFTYPTRPDKPVFAGLDLDLPAGKVTALVRMSIYNIYTSNYIYNFAGLKQAGGGCNDCVDCLVFCLRGV